MVKGVMSANKSMSGGRIAGANCFVNKARAINNAKRADYDRNKQTDSVQKELRIREDAIASGRLSERDAALLETRQKREAKEAKAALFLAQAEMAALALDDCDSIAALVRLPGQAARATPVASSAPLPPPLLEAEPHGVAAPQPGGGAPTSAARVVTVTRIGKAKKYGYRGQATYDD